MSELEVEVELKEWRNVEELPENASPLGRPKLIEYIAGIDSHRSLAIKEKAPKGTAGYVRRDANHRLGFYAETNVTVAVQYYK